MAIGQHLLNKTATVTRPTYDDTDGQGGDIELLSIHPTDPTVSLRYFAASAREQIQGGRDDEKIYHIGYTLPSVSIVRDDRLFVDSKRFDVIAVLEPSKSHHLKLQLEEVHGVYLVVETKEGFTIHSKDDQGNLTALEVKN